MALEQFANNAGTTLNGAINNSVTSLVVTSATGFPSSGNFRILIGTEILLVTAVSGTTFTVTRGAESTTAASHSDLDTVTLILTTGSFGQFVQDRGGFVLGDYKPISPGTYDEEFEGTADTLPTNWAWASAPSGSDESKINSRWPSLLTVEGTGGGSFTLTRSSFSPASTFGLWAKVYNGTLSATDVQNLRMNIRNSGDTEGQGIELRPGSAQTPQVRGLKLISSVESTDFGITNVNLPITSTYLYMGLTRDSGNVWRAWYSNNGVAWQLYGSASSAHSFTVAKFIFLMGTTSSFQSFQAIDWVRYRADLLFPRP